jgi:hypothetical protein
MATIDVNTWDELKTAIQTDWTENKIINIMSDIDVSDTILTEGLTKPIDSYTYAITINGNSHKINGITSYSSIYLFTLNNATINDLHFSNIAAANATFSRQGSRVVSEQYRCNWNRCYINGVMRRICYEGLTSSYYNYQYYNNCSFNIKSGYIGGEAYGTEGEFKNCYILYETFLTSANSYPGYLGGRFNNCYIGGKFEYNRSGSASMSNLISNTIPVRCCFNLEFINHATGSLTVYMNATSSQYTLFNADKMTNPPTTTYSFENQMINLTDSEMKNPAVISARTNNTFLYQD